MATIEQLKVDTIDLELGMFVSARDRPWSQTSFPLHGFQLKSHREITALRTLCQYVYVDVAKSTTANPDKLRSKQPRVAGSEDQYRASQTPIKMHRARYERQLGLPEKKI